MLHPLCIVISKHDRGFKVILEGGLLLWGKCIGQKTKNPFWIEVFHEIVDFFALDMCSKPIFCSKIALKGKTCSRLLKPQKVAPNAKSCSKVAEHNRDRPTGDYRRKLQMKNECNTLYFTANLLSLICFIIMKLPKGRRHGKFLFNPNGSNSFLGFATVTYLKVV